MKVTLLVRFLFFTWYLISSSVLGQKVDEADREKFVQAALENNVNTLKSMLEANPALLNSVDKNGWSALHETIRHKRYESMKYLLGAGGDIALLNSERHSPFDIALLNHRDDNELISYLIHYAANRGYVKYLETIFSTKDTRLIQPDGNGWNIIHEAAAGGRINVLNFIRIIEGSEQMGGIELIHSKTKDGKTALDIAKEVQPNNKDLLTLLQVWSDGVHKAAVTGDVDTLRRLAKTSPEKLNVEDQNGWKPIHEAARGGHVDAFRYLWDLLGANKRGGIKATRKAIVDTKLKSGSTIKEIVKDVHGVDHEIYKIMDDL